MKNQLKCTFLLFTLLFSATILFAQDDKGIIRGKILDKASGEPLMFTNVMIQNSNPPIGAQTDLDGNYEIRVAPGTYSLIVSYVGYTDNIIGDVEVVKSNPQVVNFFMEVEGVTIATVEVTTERIERTGNAILALQAKAFTVQDGIAADDISKRGVSNAAETMQSVTGASVVDGKYIYVRGLGDRYSNALMNGQPIPSTDPYRNSSQLDLIPANLLDNIIASKTFTPDQPGNFTGGSVNIKTKSFPERFTLSASVSSTFNTQSSFRDDFLTQTRRGTDWLGFDDGSRAIPSFLSSNEVQNTLVGTLRLRARTNAGKADTLNQAAQSLNSELAPIRARTSFNHGASISFGNQYRVGDNPLGILIGLNYRRSFSFIENGLNQYFEITDASSGQLNNYFSFNETTGVDNPVLGGLFTLSYKFGGSNKLSFNALYNHDTENRAQYLVGPHPGIISGSGVFESRVLSFTERGFQSYQLNGEHVIAKGGIKVEWGGSLVDARQKEPDLRQFANTLRVNDSGDTTYIIDQSEFDLPYHYFRDLNDRQYSGKLDITIPFAQEKSRANKIKFGALYSEKERSFVEDVFQLNNDGDGVTPYTGNALDYFGADNSGITGVNPDNGRNLVGLFPIYQANTSLENSYDGTERVIAGYGMGVYDFGKLKVVGGVRLEQTDYFVASRDTTEEVGEIDILDVLPSANLIYNLVNDGTRRMNLRASFSQTVARPNMRELAPFSAISAIGQFRETGNPELRRTKINNYDLRWEYFPKPGEMFAVSFYYKDFIDPIVRSYLTQAPNPEVQFQNMLNAKVYGTELEVRKNLGFITPALKNFKLATNLSLISSVVDISEDEVEVIKRDNPDKGETRPFQGQSPFLLNASLNYNNPEQKIDAIITYNVFGERLSEISEAADPDIYEQPRSLLNASVKKTFENGFGIRLSARNLLDATFKRTMDFKGTEYTIQEFRRGISFGINLSYTIK